MAWDYKTILAGTPARFAGSDLVLTITDDKGNNTVTRLDGTGIPATANAACVAEITVNSLGIASLKNVSEAITLNNSVTPINQDLIVKMLGMATNTAA